MKALKHVRALVALFSILLTALSSACVPVESNFGRLRDDSPESGKGIEARRLIAALATAIDDGRAGRRAASQVDFVLDTAPAGAADSGYSPLLPVSAELRQLVALGADAVPSLLASLDDHRPVAVKLRLVPVYGLTRIGLVPMRADWTDSTRATRMADIDEIVAAANERPAQGYTIVVADLCAYALGQIVNRPYEVLIPLSKYGIGVCSIVADPGIAVELRQTWGGLTHAAWREGLIADAMQNLVHRKRANALARLAAFFPDDHAECLASLLSRTPATYDATIALGNIVSDTLVPLHRRVADAFAGTLVPLPEPGTDRNLDIIRGACAQKLIDNYNWATERGTTPGDDEREVVERAKAYLEQSRAFYAKSN
ncbi:MAG: hypothetical protein IPP14_10630 [Planctomycetes bacterium]|nr:hypothetical protein [Planctomycetota bacterium]